MERWGLTVDAWGGFSAQGKTDLVFYEDTLNAQGYQDILQNSLLPAAEEWFEDEKQEWEFQQRQGFLSHGEVHQALAGAAWGWSGGSLAHQR